MSSGGYNFFIDIRDYCILNTDNAYECNRLTDNTDSQYNSDIFSFPLEINFDDLNTGQYEAKFEIPGSGWVTISVFQIISNRFLKIFK